MARTYVTKRGEDLDLICHREYGRQAGAVEQVLAANPELSNVAHDLPPGQKIVLPDLSALRSGDSQRRLWD